MIEGEQYIIAVKKYYSFLIDEFNLPIITEKIHGNAFYQVEYGDEEKVISISYENIEDYLQVIIFNLENGKKPQYDDKTRTLHLNILNKNILKNIDRETFISNSNYFSNINTENQIEEKLLKEAKELRLCLHISRQN